MSDKTFLRKLGLNLPADSKGELADKARSAEDWYNWRIEMRNAYPIRYFLNEEFAPMFIWPVTMPLEYMKDWIRYRTTHRHHIVKTGEEPGYSDTGTRMFHSSFNLLKDFVEVEKAHMWQWCHIKGSKERELVGADAGIAYLKWEMSLCKDIDVQNSPECADHSQAHKAKEIYALYNWWVHSWPNRAEPFEGADWDKLHAMREEVYSTGHSMASHLDTPEMTELQDDLYARATKLEAAYSAEDTKMFIRLAKVREGLWT